MTDLRVLVVDDEPQILRFLRPALEASGYQVLHAAAGREALRLIANSAPDMIVLDLGLPDMDGKDVLAEARKFTSAPILILSARDREAEKIAALDLGADDYVEKPFAIGELLARLRTALRHRGGAEAAPMHVEVDGLAIDMDKRRVTKDGGLMFLQPAWNCASWYADGYEVRPYSDFGVKGKLIKASLLLRASPYYRASYLLPTRFLRWETSRMMSGPTRYHYSLLEPNWSKYWVVDSDAINALDYVETMVWFTSRGDECLNCGSNPVLKSDELIIRVHKKPAPAVATR